MRNHKIAPAVVALLTAALVTVTACGTATTTSAEDSGSASGASSGSSPAPNVPPGAPAGEAILSLPITDARTGEVFTLADFRGQPVYVENFATWCTNCRQQLQHVQAAAANAPDDVAFISLSVETDLSADDIASYAADEGFDDIRFAVMSPELLAAMNERMGTSALNPPSTPHFVIAADGSIGELVTGFEEPDQVLASLGVAGS